MALMRNIILLSSMFVVVVKMAPLAPPTATVDCSSASYSVEMEFASTSGTSYSQDVTVTIGDTCSSTGSVNYLDSSVVVSVDSSSYGDSSSPACGGSLILSNSDTIVYTASVEALILEMERMTITRQYLYDYTITCTLTRDQTVNMDGSGFTVSGVVKETSTLDGSSADTFEMDVVIDFLNSVGGTAVSSGFVVNNKDMLTVEVKEQTTNDEFKFTVQNCYAGMAQTLKLIDDKFLEDECPVDNTVSIKEHDTADTDKFVFQMRAFYYNTISDKHYIHCEIFVCATEETGDDKFSGKCDQNPPDALTDAVGGGCTAPPPPEPAEEEEEEEERKRRKRRSTESKAKKEEIIRTMLATSENSFTLADDFYAPRCPGQFVYDAIKDDCTNERILRIKGVNLALDWHQSYANTNSSGFKTFAKTTVHRIQSLVRNNGKDDIIRGLKIISVANVEGNVNLDVLVTFSEDVNAEKAFATLQDVLYNTTPQMDRVINLLNFRKDRIIEYVPIVSQHQLGIDKILIIVIVAAVLVVAFICAITFYRVKKVRERPSPNMQGNNGIVNVGMEKA